MCVFYKYVLIVIILITVFPDPVLAGEPPALVTPEENSTVSSSKLIWQNPSYALYSPNPFRIQIDDNSDFSSIDKDYYTKNAYYTPSLSDGLWFWKVKAKDSTGTWSDWSSIWKFTLSSVSPTPQPSATITPTPIPTLIPSPSASSSPTPPPTPQVTSSFTISNTASQINSDQSFTVYVNLSQPAKPNIIFYLKGAFKKTDGSNYFGETLVSASWVKNNSSYSNQYQITTDPSGNWSDNLNVKVDTQDSGYSGSGDYIFKVARYDTNGNGPNWSNDVVIKIIGINNTSPIPSPTNKTSPSTAVSFSPIVSPSKLLKSSPSTPILKIKPPTKIASVAGITTNATFSATLSAKIKVSDQKQNKSLVWIGLFFIFAGCGSLGYLSFRKKNSII